MRHFVLLSFVLLFVPGIASAQSTGVGLPEITVTCEGGELYVSPAGRGPTLESAGATITVEILDGNLQPIVGYPFQDVWIEDQSFEGFVSCVGGAVADHDTDAQGITTFTGAPSAGGQADSDMFVYVAGIQVTGPPLPIDVNSPDINGDLSVDLADVALFAFDYANGYAFRSDFTHDGALTLADVGLMVAHVGESCP